MRFVKLYEPALLVVLVREAPVFTSVTVTFAPGTIAPEGSVTVPVIRPEPANCAINGVAITANPRIAKTFRAACLREIDVDIDEGRR